MLIPLVQGFGKVIAFRLKRPKQKGRTLHNSTTTNHEGISSIPASVSNPVPALVLSSISSLVPPISAISQSALEASIDRSSARYSGGVSLAREASDMAQVALPLVQAIVGAIPLVGAPMQAAISGIMTSLQAIDRRSQNKSGLDALTSRLNRLYLNLRDAPPARDPAEQRQRDAFAKMLQDTSARVAALHKRCLASTPVTQDIAGCFTDIDRYLADYLLSFQMQSQQSQHDIQEKFMILQRQIEDQNRLLITTQSTMIRLQFFMGPSASPGAIALGCVTLVDATGHHHDIPMNFCTSYQQLNDMLPVLFQRDAIEGQIQRRYIEKGEYDLCIDEGTQVTPLTSYEWSSIEAGTKIVMRVTIQQETISLFEVDYKCRFCGAVNRLGVRSVKYESRGRTVCSTDCRECKRRFQITRALVHMDTLRRSSNSDSNHTTDAETRLIRNFHVQQVFHTGLDISGLLVDADSATAMSRSQAKKAYKLALKTFKYWAWFSEKWFLHLARKTPGMSPRPSHASRAHDVQYGSSGIEEIEYDSDEGDETEEGWEYEMEEDSEDETEEDSEDGTEEGSEYGTAEGSDDFPM